MVDLEADDEAINLSSSSDTDEHLQHQSKRARSAGCIPSPKQKKPVQSYPASVSIDQLLKAGKLVKSVSKTKTVLNLESFDISQKEWVTEKSTTMFIDDARFALGAFRDAFKARSESGVNLGCLLQQIFLYAVWDGTPVTVEEFVAGEFTKYINNDGMCTHPSEISERCEEVFQKAECFAHYTYVTSNQKFMLLDIQGSEYSLYDPEIATQEHCDEMMSTTFVAEICHH